METRLKYWYWLGVLTGLTALQARRLLDIYVDPYEIYVRPKNELYELDFLTSHNVDQITNPSLRAGIDEKLASLSERGIRVVSQESGEYPALIKEIPDPPLALFMRGDAASAKNSKNIAVVGSRRPTAYGVAMTKKIVEGLAAFGFAIVSGLAMGIDAVAHRTALENGAKTYAFLGGGVDRAYPASNRRLMEDVIRGGAVFSEYPPGSVPYQHNFPRRNRLISGMSVCVAVIEAGERSGALITARCAGEQGRDVFAVPGNATSPLSVGANALIRDGALIATTAEDIVFSLNSFLGAGEEQSHETKELKIERRERELASLNGAESGVIRLLRARGPQEVDAIAAHSGMSAGDAVAAAIKLEIRGLLRRGLDGAYYYSEPI